MQDDTVKLIAKENGKNMKYEKSKKKIIILPNFIL